MTSRTVLLYLAVLVPPLGLAIVGTTHPEHLTASSAEYWRNLHIALLPVFPLLGFGPWLVIRGYDRFLTWVVGILGFVYAAFYTGLDVLAGIGAGGLKLDDMGMATGTLFGLGRDIGFVGSVAFIAACGITALASFRRAGVLAGRDRADHRVVPVSERPHLLPARSARTALHRRRSRRNTVRGAPRGRERHRDDAAVTSLAWLPARAYR